MADLPSSLVPLGGLLLLAAGVAATLGFARPTPVSRGRLERFAWRHQVTITATNGNQVINYLATTRRWRTAGVIAGLAISLALSLPRHELRIGVVPLLAGWFAGAVIAETRVTHLSHGPRRGAALLPRDPSRYLPRTHRLLVPVTTGLCLVLGAVTLVVAAAGRALAAPPLLALVAGLGIACAVHFAQRRVRRRPQPPAEADQLASDEAIRSRSLHALAASGAVLVSFCMLAQAQVLLLALAVPAGWWLPPLVVASVLVPLVGWLLATARWIPRTPADLVSTAPAAAPDGS